MSRNNKARRAAKAKQRARRGTPRSRAEREPFFGADPFRPTPAQQVAALWFELEVALRGQRPDVPPLAERLATFPQRLVDGYAEAVLLDMIAALWESGWQPRELRRHVRNKGTAAAARLIELAILADHDRRVGQPVDERWATQLREFGQRDVSTRDGWLTTWRDGEGLRRAEGIPIVGTVLTMLSRLPALDILLPPPGASASAARLGVPGSAAGTVDPMLARIRKLLSKAESTEFEEEAAALTAKAQELMTRHAIDHAAVDVSDAQDVPRLMRLPVEAPYADAKSLLLAVVAQANRCRSVYLDGLEMSAVAGHAGDLSVIEILFTSLLVQAQNALTEAARPDNMGRRARSQSFRSSFFIGYAHRIEERLTGVNDRVVAEAGGSGSLPVLRAREHAVEEFISERFGESLHGSAIRGGYDYAGQSFGRRAADDAKLDSGELLW